MIRRFFGRLFPRYEYGHIRHTGLWGLSARRNVVNGEVQVRIVRQVWLQEPVDTRENVEAWTKPSMRYAAYFVKG